MSTSQRAFLLTLGLLVCGHCLGAASPTPSPESAKELAKEAYIAAYAPVQNYAKQSPRAFDQSKPLYTGTNRLFNVPILFNYYIAQAGNIASPNHDTLYSSGVLDLRQQPVVVSAGAVADPNRYYSLALYDLNTNVLPYISSLTNNNQGGNYLILGPDNPEPSDTSAFTQVIHAPSRIVTILGRVQVANDLDLIGPIKVQQHFKIRALSDYLGTEAPKGYAEALPAYDETAAQGLGFLQYANLAFNLQPPDAALASRLAAIHVGPGQDFAAKDFSPEVLDAIQQGLTEGAVAVEDASLSHNQVRNGWTEVDPSVLDNNGSFGTDYLARAAVAHSLIYINTRTEAWYAIAYVDANGTPLTGDQDYHLHFAPGTLPESRFLWSLTAYDANTHLFFNHWSGRYSVGSNTHGLRYNDDGSLDIHIRSRPPANPTQLADWLPVERGRPFYLILRSYGPGKDILDGTYVAPAVEQQP